MNNKRHINTHPMYLDGFWVAGHLNDHISISQLLELLVLLLRDLLVIGRRGSQRPLSLGRAFLVSGFPCVAQCAEQE